MLVFGNYHIKNIENQTVELFFFFLPEDKEGILK